MDLLEKVYEKIEQNRDDMLEDLSQLIRIPSVATENGTSAPFGEGVHKAFMKMLEMADAAGFETWNADNRGGHIEFPAGPDGTDEVIGVLGHLDVVPEGSGWDFDPYAGDIVDGYIRGRGTADDKGPVVASFYAMKALKECGYLPKRGIRLILGLDEETNWYGMDHYMGNVDKVPVCGFTPDADFPVIRGEMGILTFKIARKFLRAPERGLELSSIVGGTVPNAVPDDVTAVIYDSEGRGYDDIKQKVAEFRESHGCRINCRGVGKSLRITVGGVAAHGSQPQLGRNAISLMMEFLGGFNFASDDINDFIAFYNDCLGFDFHGERIGCGLSDEPSGRLILNVGKIELNKQSAQLDINIRYPITLNADMVYDGMMTVLDRYGIGIIKGRDQLPICFESDHPLVSTLMDIYRRHTGDEAAEATIFAGGTYARAMDNAVAFGARFSDQPRLEHQKNEQVSVENVVRIAKIYAEAIYRLAEQ